MQRHHSVLPLTVTQPISCATPHTCWLSPLLRLRISLRVQTDKQPILVKVFLEPEPINYECGVHVFSSVVEMMSGAGWVSPPHFWNLSSLCEPHSLFLLNFRTIQYFRKKKTHNRLWKKLVCWDLSIAQGRGHKYLAAVTGNDTELWWNYWSNWAAMREDLQTSINILDVCAFSIQVG